ncbi:hypothetical protein [Gordonia phthalatica]|uniref:Uncharacterized protein n=1 Tax=Gordonia phthalatica TaxID=1136941 RepID=A0A0N9NFR7_9ACTN|nr:hypothetical protein [Gordonia phthalatica]ALG84160.1 hypothetical protein ACH46_06130 [Gordonia phthalatica]
MSEEYESGVCVDLDVVDRLTRTQQDVVAVVDACAVELASGDLCRWADDGPVRRAAEQTADQLRDLAARFRSCGIAVDAVATDLARAGRAFSDAEDAAVAAVTAWTR